MAGNLDIFLFYFISLLLLLLIILANLSFSQNKMLLNVVNLLLVCECRLSLSKADYLLYKVKCFIRILGTDKTDNLACEIIYDNFTRDNYRFSNNH